MKSNLLRAIYRGSALFYTTKFHFSSLYVGSVRWLTDPLYHMLPTLPSPARCRQLGSPWTGDDREGTTPTIKPASPSLTACLVFRLIEVFSLDAAIKILNIWTLIIVSLYDQFSLFVPTIHSNRFFIVLLLLGRPYDIRMKMQPVDLLYEQPLVGGRKEKVFKQEKR